MRSTKNFMNIPKRSEEDYLGSHRSELKSHLKTELAKSKDVSPVNKITDFLSKRLWSWLYHYIKSRFGPVNPYPFYPEGESGIYTLEKSRDSSAGPISIAVVSDWGSDTEDSFTIADQIKKHQPDYTIHVGDTYFVGAPHEIKSNFIEEGSPWVRGGAGSFAVLGNHEMYARGISFFRDLLPTLGIKTKDGVYSGQKTSFFCLENDYWRIIGLDTGYHSIGKFPIIEFLPWFVPKSQFNKMLMDWLVNKVHLDKQDDKRGILILTHHQYITAFNKELEYLVPAEQLASIIGKEKKVLWLWGHEHKFALYEKAQAGNGVTAYGRCLGNGGIPVEVGGPSFKRSSKTKGSSKLVMADHRIQKEINNIRLGFNGYAVIRVDKQELRLEYYDNKNFLLSEKWTVDNDGNLSGNIEIPSGCPLSPEPGKSWEDAVRP